jgi:PKD repeat protein
LDATVNEDSAFVGVGSLSDPDSRSWSASVDYGDGSSLQTLSLNADRTFQLSHVYADNGTYTVKLTVTDSDQQSRTDTLTATVANVQPTLAVPGLQTVAEGAVLDLTQIGQFTDPGFTYAAASTSEAFTYSINWGDGTAPIAGNVTAVQQGGADVLTHGTFGGSHIYADNGNYTVIVTVTDDDAGADTKTFSVTVTNVAPTLTVAGNQAADEGSTLSITDIGVFTDPGFANALNTGGEVAETFTYTVDWGDGTTQATGAATIDQVGSPGTLTGGSFDGSHTYSLAGTYAVTVRVTDDDSGLDEQQFDIVVTAPAQSEQSESESASGRATSQGFAATLSQDSVPSVTVSRVAPTGDVAVATDNEPPTLWGPGNLTIDEGPFTMSDLGGFMDPDSTGPFRYSLDWGDGTAATTGTATIDLPGPPSAGSFDGSHVYGDDGLFDLSMAVTDEQGATSTEVFEVTVNNVAPQFENVVITTPISEGGTATLTGNIIDPGIGDPHVLVVTWGDGETNTYHYAAGTASFRETHQYSNNQPQDAPFVIHMELADDDEPDKPATADLSIVVKNLAPTVVDDIYTHVGGGALIIDAAHGVLVNDTDAGNDPLTVIEYGVPSTGTLEGHADGSFTYTPPSDDFSGIVRFTYKAMDSDGAVSANAATVTIDSALRGSISGFVRMPLMTCGFEPLSIGIPGVTITLTETTSQDVVKITTITGDDGSYRFGGLRVGAYTVTETQPAALLPGGSDTLQVVLSGDDAKTGVDFVEGPLRTQVVSLRNFLSSAPSLEAVLTPSNVRQLIARGEEQAGHATQAAAIRAGGSQTTVLVAGTSGDDSIRFIAGPTYHKVYVNDHSLIFVAAEVEAFKIDGGAGRDTAQLVGSTSADIVTLRPAPESSALQLPDYSLRGAAYVVTVEDVENVTAEGGGGYDRAYLFDSAGDDLLSLDGKSARLTPWAGDEFWIEAVDFDWVRAAGTAGGQDAKQLNGPIDFVLETEGNWTD